MLRKVLIVVNVLGAVLACAAPDPPAKASPIRLFLSESQAGATQVQQYCAVVFADRRFHYERASIHHGKDVDRKVYEGEFSEADWNALGGVLDASDFRALNVPREVAPLVMQDSHVYTISVAREAHFQNMEFLDEKSLRPYEAQVKPLLEWWKSFRGHRMSQSRVPADAHCLPDNIHTVFSQ